MSKNDEENSWSVYDKFSKFWLLGAAALSGVVSRSIVHPMDTLRANMMTGQGNTTKSTAALSAPNFQSLWTTFRWLITSSGIKSLYRGFGVSVTVQAPAVATYLTTYDLSKNLISKKFEKHSELLQSSSPLTHLCSGFIAEAVSAVFWVPMEVLKQRVQVRSKDANSLSALRDLLKYEGPRTLFKGYFLTLGVFGPYSMIYFVCYERFKLWGRKLEADGSAELPLPIILSCAASSGAVAAACTTPFDVIKTRYQIQGDILYQKGSVYYRNSWDVARKILQQEGWRGFFRGLSARVLWIMPGTAITMSSFEWFKQLQQRLANRKKNSLSA